MLAELAALRQVREEALDREIVVLEEMIARRQAERRALGALVAAPSTPTRRPPPVAGSSLAVARAPKEFPAAPAAKPRDVSGPGDAPPPRSSLTRVHRRMRARAAAVEEAIDALGGEASRQAITAWVREKGPSEECASFGKDQFDWAVKSGWLQRVRRGTYRKGAGQATTEGGVALTPKRLEMQERIACIRAVLDTNGGAATWTVLKRQLEIMLGAPLNAGTLRASLRQGGFTKNNQGAWCVPA